MPHKRPFSVACASKYDQHQQCCWKRNFVCLKICLTNYFRQVKENNGFVAPALAAGHKAKGLEGFPERLVPGAILCRDRIPPRLWEAVSERGPRGSPASHLGKNTLPAALEPSIPTNCCRAHVCCHCPASITAKFKDSQKIQLFFTSNETTFCLSYWSDITSPNS